MAEKYETSSSSPPSLCSPCDEALLRVWRGAIPLQIHLHESDITTLPPPPPVLVLGSRVGYLPLLVPLLKAHFSNSLPPGNDTVWFDYKGLPLKWYIPTGVLFDLLCAEPERPWNLTVHFRGRPGEILTPCEGEDTVKWSYINSLKEAAYIITGNSKTIMNMSQADQVDLWQSLLKGNFDMYNKVSSRLKLGPVGEDGLIRMASLQNQQSPDEPESVGSGRPCRIPVRLYVRNVGENLNDLEDAASVEAWERIIYINRPFDIHKEEDTYVTLRYAMKILLPEIFDDELSIDDHISIYGANKHGSLRDSENSNSPKTPREGESSSAVQRDVNPSDKAKVKLIRVQGIELDMDIPFLWVVNNLKNPEHYLHICLYISTSQQLRIR